MKCKNNTIRYFVIVGFFLVFPVIAAAATLSLSPASGNYNVGDIFSVQIMLDTQGQPADGIDIRYLNYNPALLEVQDEDVFTAGIQIAPGNLMPSTTFDVVDQAGGKITFSQITSGNATFTGSGVLATARFKALAAGNSDAIFNFTPGDTSDTNVASAGTDILTSVTNGSYQLVVPPPPPPTDHMLSLLPSSGSFKTGDIVPVQIILNTKLKNIDGVDAVLSYDSRLLAVKDSDSNQNGIQISVGNLMPSTQRNEVVESYTTGKIYFSQTTSGNSVFSGGGVLATANFRAKSAGKTSVPFSFTLGNTNDSNMSLGGVDFLESVSNASFDIVSNNLPPVISDGEPTGIINLPKTLVLKVNTNEASYCRYSSEPYTAYDLMNGRFSSSNLINHSVSLTKGFSVGNNYFYVKCKDLSGSISEADFVIFVNIVEDSVPPVIVSAFPSSAVFLPRSLTLKINTDEPSYCRYSLTPNTPYDFMTKIFSGSGIEHTATVYSGLTAGQNNFYVRCKDNIGNSNASDYNLAVNTVTPPRFIVDLEGPTNMSAASVTVILYYAGSTTEALKFTNMPDGTGVVTFPSSAILSPGFYDIKVSANYYLSRKLNNFNLTAGSAVFFPTLLGGDLNGDGVINTLDWSKMDMEWGKTYVVSDVNKDRIVNSSDWGYLRKNWLQKGE